MGDNSLREKASFLWPSGRPKWEANTTDFAPWFNANLIVGIDATILVLSDTTPFLIGTLKSTLIKILLSFN